MSFIWHNGALIHDKLALSVNDRAFRGHGVFDTMLAVDGEPHYAALHLRRLSDHAQLMGIGTPAPDELEQSTRDLLRKNDFTKGRHAVNTLITAGPGERGLSTPVDLKPQIVIRAGALPDTSPPIRAIIAQTVRRNEGSPLSQIKSCNYGDNILAMREAESQGANEAIMLNNAGHVSCATAGNIFAVMNGALVTPPLSDGVLGGIARALIMKNYDVIERSLMPEDIKSCEGLYLSNSLRGAAIIETLDGITLPRPGLQIDKDIHLE